MTRREIIKSIVEKKQLMPGYRLTTNAESKRYFTDIMTNMSLYAEDMDKDTKQNIIIDAYNRGINDDIFLIEDNAYGKRERGFVRVTYPSENLKEKTITYITLLHYYLDASDKFLKQVGNPRGVYWLRPDHVTIDDVFTEENEFTREEFINKQPKLN